MTEDASIVPASFEKIQFRSELEKRAATSIARTVWFGIQLTQRGLKINNQPLISNPENGEIFFSVSSANGISDFSFSPSQGLVSNSDLFVSTRDGWNKMDHYPFNTRDDQYAGLPKIRGTRDEKGQPIIVISANSEGSSDFNHRLLSGGARFVRLNQSGELTTNAQYGDGDRDLTPKELEECERIFDDAFQKLQERAERM